MAFIPDSFRNDFDNQLLFIIIEQKLETNLMFSREFYIYKFEVLVNNTANIILDKSYKVPEFLKQIPTHYYINGILNTFDYSCKDKNKCTNSAILLVTVNGILKYCITNEDTLSVNVYNN